MEASLIPSLKQCVLLLPGYEFDGFPRELPGEQAAELLAGWVALWHPSILARLASTPMWRQADLEPAELEGSLIVAPSCIAKDVHAGYPAASAPAPESASALESALGADVAVEGCALFAPTGDWRANQRDYLGAVGLHSLHSADAQPNADAPAIIDDVLAQFAALGFAYLQIQLMTRQLRYTSNLNEDVFAEQVREASTAALAGDANSEELLQACFDSLGQERDHYYSLDVHLIDVTLLAKSTLGSSLQQQLRRHAEAPLKQSLRTNYLASAGLLAELAQQDAQTFALLQSSLEKNASGEQRACIVGGLELERPHPLMSRESLARELQRGAAAYKQLALQPPAVFARMSFGMLPDQASELERHGYAGAMLVAWAEGEYPDGSQRKFSWEASDGKRLSALGGQVLDASAANSYLALGWTVGEALEQQHVPTLVFAHWPNQSCDFFELLTIVAARTPALGRWENLDEYFEQTDVPYHHERLSAALFQYNWLAESPAPDALIEATKQLHVLSAQSRSLQNLANLAWQLEHPRRPAVEKNVQVDGGHKSEHDVEPEVPAALESPAATALPMAQWEPALESFQNEIDGLLDAPAIASQAYAEVTQKANQLADSITERLARALCGRSIVGALPNSSTGELLLNPRSCPLRFRVQSGKDELFAAHDWNTHHGLVGHHRYTNIDVPSMGFVVAPYASSGDAAMRQKSKRQALLAEGGGLLRNEYLEAQVDSSRGHLRSLYLPGFRGNRLSLMVARRDRNDDSGATQRYKYSQMRATDVRMLTGSNMCGLVRAEGYLDFEGQKVAKFQIDYEIWLGSRVLEVAVRLSDVAAPDDRNLWRSAYILRLAWANESAILRTFASDRRQAWPSGKAISPNLIEIDETDYRLHYLPGGLGFHRRTDPRFLETVLPTSSQVSAQTVTSKTATWTVEHRVGIGVDLPYPTQAAEDFVDRRYAMNLAGTKPAQAQHAWLASANVKTVNIDFESPLVDAQGRTVGLRLFLTECSGKSTTAKIRLLHDIASAHRTDARGQRSTALQHQDDTFTIPLRASEHTTVDVQWSPA